MAFASSYISVRAFAICILLITAIAATEATTNFSDCFNKFIDDQNNHIYDKNTSVLYQGLIYPHRKPTGDDKRYLLSTNGCQMLCGSGPQYYPWSQIAATITTWVLPVIGILLQAPYESNEFRKTLYALVRWIGSPIVSLSYILWNIKVIGKCAMLSDMSTSFIVQGKAREQVESAQHMDKMRDMRDSLYILSVMNQYSVKSSIDTGQAATLLRVALFADINTPNLNLTARRQRLATTLREGRKRGIVPVFVTLMWFLFSLAISIEGDFSELGENATAHDIALGLLLAWFPVLILSSIVDRNPTQPTATCTKLNRLLKKVEIALRTDGVANELIQNITGDDVRRNKPGRSNRFGRIIRAIGRAETLNGDGLNTKDPSPLASNFFNEFGGQGRLRWHSGVAFPLLAGMESIILDKCEKNNARNWLQISGVQNDLVRGPEKEVLLLDFDIREFWEILGAFVIVMGTISGSFVLSFRTPTVGLGCRTGGYVVFGTIAIGIFILELLTWSFTVAPARERSNRTEQIADETRRKYLKLIATLNWIFRLCELVNTVWLIYIVMAQTLGSYQTCECQAADWGDQGGYINARYALNAGPNAVGTWWITGVLLSSLIMFTAIAFLVIEWCEQSHLNSLDFDKAMHGLKITQQFKYRTLWIRRIPGQIIDLCKWTWRTLSNSLWNKRKKKEKGRESIRWSHH